MKLYTVMSDKGFLSYGPTYDSSRIWSRFPELLADSVEELNSVLLDFFDEDSLMPIAEICKVVSFEVSNIQEENVNAHLLTTTKQMLSHESE